MKIITRRPGQNACVTLNLRLTAAAISVRLLAYGKTQAILKSLTAAVAAENIDIPTFAVASLNLSNSSAAAKDSSAATFRFGKRSEAVQQ